MDLKRRETLNVSRRSKEMKKTYYHGTSIQNAEQILKDGKQTD